MTKQFKYIAAIVIMAKFAMVSDAKAQTQVKVTSTGNVGVGTSSPSGKFNVVNGSVLFNGTTGSTPVSGAGTRLMWIPSLSAFRAGVVSGSTWDNANIGLYSCAFGGDTKASGWYGSAFGSGTTASGLFSASFGYQTTAQPSCSFVIGQFNVISGNPTSWVSTDPLFVIGNGSAGAPSNALTVLKNGNAGIGTASPQNSLEIYGTNQQLGLTHSAGSITAATPAIRYYASVSGTLTEMYVLGDASGGDEAFAVWNRRNDAMRFGTNNTERITITAGGNVGIGTPTPGAYKLYVNGTSYFNGNGTYNGTWTSSDQQLKTAIDTIANASEIISQLTPRTYFYDTANVYGLNFSNKRQYGFVAQELAEILPELVKEELKEQEVDTLGNVVHPGLTFKSVNYIELIAVLTKALQEQQKQIESVKEDLLAKTSELNNRLNSCCTIGETRSTLTNGSYVNQTDIKLTNTQSIVLEQNVPNPFAEQTSISYYLPDNTKKAQLLFYNAQGRLIQSTDLNQKGKGVVNVFASDLSNGIYTYTLVVDGKVIETKKMVKQ